MIIGNGIVLTNDEAGQVLHAGAVLVRGQEISEVGDFALLKAKYPQEEVYDVGGRLIMPGMINAHSHIYSAFARGFGPKDPTRNFLEILENLWWHLDKELTVEDARYSAYGTLSDSIAQGVTTVIDHHASPHHITGSLSAIAEAARDLGIRTSLCYETSDRDGEAIAREGIRENADFIRQANADDSGLIHGLFGLHASFTLSEETLYACREAAQGLDTGFHIHVAEGSDDEAVTQTRYGMRVVHRLEKHGILGPKTLAVHCIHADDEELDRILATDTMVVHNPESNMGNAVGTSPVIKMLKKGILVGLGTDAYTNDMFESMKVAKILQSHALADPTVGFGEALTLQFKNNPRILSRYFKKPLGLLSPGAYADLIVVDYDPLTPLNQTTWGGHVLFGLSGYKVKDTMINGRFVMKDRVFLTVDHPRLMAQCRDHAQKLWSRL
ncbi:putative aminohydrolase SsnA [Proteiniclasticum sp. QWL-01]|uniref:putative aminohydrolase SsnA n=1 Tax=Proteiniclasticum sp. QWL-01 TaxID=3036945 RepID=UPI00240EA0A9|nr:putative aminohydrolase SsnA [Proteiniclasticum sp. QWL-01]WFF72767.1 putative aminohydrolase SsnA [Proteiniclasticum sp. QWL-01]